VRVDATNGQSYYVVTFYDPHQRPAVTYGRMVDMKTAQPIRLLVALVVLLVASFAVAQPKCSTKHCPKHRPETGASCAKAATQCHWRCGEEGEYNWSCSCEKDENGALHWECVKGPICTL